MGRIERSRVERAMRGVVAVAAALTLANCASSEKFGSRVDPKYGVSASPRVVDFGEAVPRGGGVYRVGKPYTVAGRLYVPEENRSYRAEGLASWYGTDFHGRRTANGEIFDMTSISAAHPTMPLPSYARVTNMRNGKSVIVRVNDRGPYHGNRIIDVSHRAAKLLDFHGHGIAQVRVDYVGRAPLQGSDDRHLEATLRTGLPAPAPSAVMVASARPFIPETPAPRGAIRGEVPVPEGRPYSLGSQDGGAGQAATSEMSGARARPAEARRQQGYALASSRTAEAEPEGEASQYGHAAQYGQTAQPASSFTSGERSGAAGLLSGRGLY